MKRILIFHDDYRYQIFPFLNYLLYHYAIIHTTIDPTVIYDCILVDEELILSDEIDYLQLLKENLCHSGTMIISVTRRDDDRSDETEVFNFAGLRISLETFLTLYDRHIEDIFGSMWNLPIEWRLIKKSK